MVNQCGKINVEMTRERIKAMSDSEKIDLLIDIGFINHEAIQHQGEILEGCEKEGKWIPGLCEVVRSHKQHLNWLWLSFTAVSSFYGGTLMIHVVK